jgi:hypothetical protein
LVTTGGIVRACLAPAGRARDSVTIYAIAGLLLFTTTPSITEVPGRR